MAFVWLALLLPSTLRCSNSSFFGEGDSLTQSAKAISNSNKQVDLLNNISLTYRKTGEFKKGLEFSKKALILSTLLKYEEGMVDAYNNQVGIYEALGENELSLDALNKGFVLAKKTNYKKN